MKYSQGSKTVLSWEGLTKEHKQQRASGGFERGQDMAGSNKPEKPHPVNAGGLGIWHPLSSVILVVPWGGEEGLVVGHMAMLICCFWPAPSQKPPGVSSEKWSESEDFDGMRQKGV